MEQQKANFKSALAYKYGYIWLNKVRQIREEKEKTMFFKQ